MLSDHFQNADKPSSESGSLPLRHPSEEKREPVRIMLIGSKFGINVITKALHHLGFAEVGDWSKPQTHPSSDKQMSILTKRIRH